MSDDDVTVRAYGADDTPTTQRAAAMMSGRDVTMLMPPSASYE